MNSLRQQLSPRWRAGLVVVVAVIALSAATWTVKGSSAQAATSTAGAAAPAPAPVITGKTNPESYADLVAQVAPAVVTIRSERRVRQTQLPDDDLFRRFFGERGPLPTPRREGGLGSGAIVSADGYVLTNNHVVEQADQIKVELHDRRVVNAKLVGADAPSDLAVLKIDVSGLKSLPLANSDRARVGDVVLAIGNPLGVGQTVTMGIISATRRATGLGDGSSFEDFLQTDAPINQGNSGGPLINTRGELLGINSQILSPSGGNIGIGFAIPASMAQSVMDQLVKTGTVKRGMLGVTIQPVTSDIAASLGLSEVRGAIVSAVTADSPADKAGVKRGDVVTKLNGEAISDSNSLRNHVARLQPGSNVALSIIRDGQERSLSAVLGELPSKREASANREGSSNSGRFGMNVQDLTADQARELGLKSTRGVVVSEVDPNGVAAGAGIRAGDVIQEVNRKPVDHASDLKAALDAAGKRPALLLVNRNGSERFVALTPRG